MGKIIKILFFITIILTQGCKDDDCGECFTPPGAFRFELIDKITGVNLFTNGAYEPNQIEIINTMNNSSIEFRFIDENNINIIQISSIGWKTETVNILVKISNENVFNLFVDAERLNEDCCSFTRYKEIRIENVESQFNSETGIYKILVE